MENAILPDSTVRSQDSKNSRGSSDVTSKRSKETLITDSERHRLPLNEGAGGNDVSQRGSVKMRQKSDNKDDSQILMLTSCSQLLLGIVLVVFGILVLVHGASLGSSGAGLWAGAGALVAGALGVVATLATSSGDTNSGFSSAHLAASLIALALSNMAAITALTAVVRDSQRTRDFVQLESPIEDGNFEAEGGWAGLLASIGLLIVSVAELLVSGYSCVTLTPKLCRCLGNEASNSNVEEDDVVSADGGKLKTKNMVRQWVFAQNHVPKNQPIYVVQSAMPMHPMIQSYGIPSTPRKLPDRYVPARTLPLHATYGPMIPPIAYATMPPSYVARGKHKRQEALPRDGSTERSKRRNERRMEKRSQQAQQSSENPLDLSQTYTGLDKKISEEFISIAMDPERKSKASSHYSSEIGTAKTR